ncbi:phosphoribosyl transferase [Streptomyces pluripotens]|uniref:Phosphoribosyl transferase n=1 Tax=Streptomyces pluripotens TaxID=1355015 RepID=A0A221NVY5_9ACTN|nr:MULTISPECIES: phosphoribosyltransferase family protein [Streptomyces]ARP69445.1 phosphoribosyl transferase [Streptomyces pluripotens]ASN23705.1 phosphoribosyl transferase [Streptomyces pluripotens]KIE27068.1 phosphoribosyl transferase [Streptomyces sp. MUSC 125]MCH0555400.1 dienelactone hydrolase family protein [Streptomyces sp. MUM 16J]
MFTDRLEAGQRLAARLEYLRGQDLVVLGLPRGGVPVAAAVADALDAPLDICLVRKLGAPYQPELGLGAIGEDGVRVLNQEVMSATGVTQAQLTRVEEDERRVLERRAARYRGAISPVPVAGRTAVVVDDGVATGSTARAACRIARARGAARIVLAVPVAPPDFARRLGGDADELVCLDTPRYFSAVGQFYADFAQVDDEEVIACLRQAARRHRQAGGTDSGDREVTVTAGGVGLRGRLTVPGGATGVVAFAHGSGSSRHSPRNRYVAQGLRRSGLGTLLFDLLTEEEEGDRTNVFDIGLLAGRLTDATRWLREEPEVEGLAVGYFGASTGAAAALWAAAEPSTRPAAVVSRGGRPDLAGPRLPAVTAPTLLIVGGADPMVLDLNREAQARLRCENRLAVVPGATHLFEEPGTLDAVTELARDWFTDHLAPAHV